MDCLLILVSPDYSQITMNLFKLKLGKSLISSFYAHKCFRSMVGLECSQHVWCINDIQKLDQEQIQGSLWVDCQIAVDIPKQL